MRGLVLFATLALIGCGSDEPPCPPCAQEVWHGQASVWCELPNGTRHGRARAWWDDERTRRKLVYYFSDDDICGRYLFWQSDGALAIDHSYDPCPY